MIGVYKITNQINNKCYIGQSRDIKERWRHHRINYKKTGAPQYNSPLYNSMRHYGIDNFKFEIIEECSLNNLYEREKYWIRYYDSYNRQKGYNLTLGGDGSWGNIIKITDEQIKQICDMLENTIIPQYIIAEIFGVGQDTISEINHGKTRYSEDRSYPLRKRACKIRELKRIPFSISEEQLLRDYSELKSFAAIGRKYNMSDHPIRRVAKVYGYTSRDLSRLLFSSKTEVKIQKRVIQMDLNGVYLREFKNTREASHTMQDEHIKQVCDGKRKQSRGFIYKYDS